MDWIIEHMKVKPWVEGAAFVYTDLVYANNTTLLNPSASDAIACLSSFGKSSTALGLHFSWNKTKLQGLGSCVPPPALSIDGNSMEAVDNFLYLGSTQS